MFYLEREYFEQMVEHARREAPLECCGLLAGRDGKVYKLYQTTNAQKSRFRYSISPKELFQLLKEIEANHWDIMGIYHSHVFSPPYPSSTDVQLAFWPEALYFIISLQEPESPQLRAFYIREGKIREEPIELI